MKFNELNYLIALGKTKHFGRAAKLCHVAQPTLSIAISNLENRLKTILFERLPHGVEPTAKGHAILAQAQIIIDEVNKLKFIASDFGSDKNQPFTLAAIYTIGAYLFPFLLQKLQKKAPGIKLHIEEGYTDELLDKLTNGEIEASIIATTTEHKNLVQLPLYKEPMYWALPFTHEKAKAHELSVEDLRGETFLILGEQHCLSQQVLEACPTCLTQTKQYLIKGTSIETIKQMIASGFGVSILPEKTLSSPQYEKLIKAVPIKNASAVRTLYLTWRLSYPGHPALDFLTRSLELN